MPEYLTAAEWPAVRGAIDISLDASNLPDDVLALPQYKGEAERWVVERNPDAATYAAGSVEYLRTQVAAIYACAALVLPAVPQLTSESFEGAYRYTRAATDTAALIDQLWTRANAAIASVVGGDPDAVRVPPRFIFTRASGRRGR